MPHWQTIVALGIVAVTLLIFVIRLVRRKPKSGCGHDCACDHPGKIGPHDHD